MSVREGAPPGREGAPKEREGAPARLREGVREALRSALLLEAELAGGRAARRLVAAGVVGVLAALGATLLVAGHPFDHHPAWHAPALTAIWSGLLIVSLAFAWLGVRTPSLPIAQASKLGLLGLAIAGLCGTQCPDPHFLRWWSTTAAGTWLEAAAGASLSALCFGLLSASAFGAAAALVLPSGRSPARRTAALGGTLLWLLLAPGVLLQSLVTPPSVGVAWTLGTGLGSYLGVGVGLLPSARRSRPA